MTQVYRPTLLALSLLCLISSLAFGQDLSTWHKQSQVAQESYYAEWPFEERKGHMIMQLDVAGKPYEFIFDTGAMNILRPEVVKDLVFIDSLTLSMTDFYGHTERINAYQLAHIEMGGLALENVVIATHTYNATLAAECYFAPFGGIIGPSLFRGGYYQIDYQAGVFRITNDLSRLPGLENAVPIRAWYSDQGTPRVPVFIDNEYVGTHKVDTGFSGYMKSGRSTVRKYRNNLEGLRTSRAYSGAGLFSNASKKGKAFEGIARRIRLGGTPAGEPVGSLEAGASPVTMLPRSSNVLGNKLLRQYRITMDITSDSLYLERVEDAPTLAQHLESWSTQGYSVTIVEDGLMVSEVVRGSVADGAGVKPGDYVIGLDGELFETTLMRDCTTLMALLAEWPSREAATPHVLMLRRGNRTLEVSIHTDEAPAATTEY